MVCMAVDRITITVADATSTEIRAAAAEAGMTVSAWIVDACGDRLRNQKLGRFLDEWEAEHGAFSEKEIEDAARRLGLDRSSPEEGS